MTAAFLAALSLSIAARYWLAHRHGESVRRNRGVVPEAFAGDIPLTAHEKAADYTLAKLRLGRIQLAFGSALLVAWTLGGGLEALDEWCRGLELGAPWTGVAFVWAALAMNGLAMLPFGIYRIFRLEQRFGFNRMTPRLLVIDLVKQVLLALILGTPLLAAVLALMQGAGSMWWVWAWALWTGFSLFLAWIFPTFLLPMFNKLTPLEAGSLAKRLATLLERVEFPHSGLFVMDGSKRSAHSNAFFAGFGSSRRIVLFDTLVKQLAEPEIEAVLAHEVGHAKLRHVIKMTLWGTVQSLAGLAVLGWLSTRAWFFEGLGVSQVSAHAALILFLWVAPVFLFLTHPLGSWMQRRYEFQADDYGAEQTDRKALASALLRIYEENAATLTPDPIHSAFYDSHPPASIRVARLRA